LILLWQESPVFDHGYIDFKYIIIPSNSKVVEINFSKKI